MKQSSDPGSLFPKDLIKARNADSSSAMGFSAIEMGRVYSYSWFSSFARIKVAQDGKITTASSTSADLAQIPVEYFLRLTYLRKKIARFQSNSKIWSKHSC